jgi:putative membrane protein
MKTNSEERTLMSYVGLSFKGFCMGASDVVPGVSGGTMAFILGIYEELIGAIRSFDLEFLRMLRSLRIKDAVDHVSLRFLLAVGAGILIAICSLAKLISWLLENQPVLIWSFFMGLILASVFTVSRYLKEWNLPTIICAVVGIIGTYLLVGIVPGSTPNSPWFLFLSGAIAICAMILPGISGSFILVLLGKYYYVLDAVNNRDLFTLIIVTLGACFGLLAFSRLLNWLLKKYHDLTIAILAGLMLGSLRKVWPWKEPLTEMPGTHGVSANVSQANILPQQFDSEFMIAIALMAIGFLIVFALNRWAESVNKR